QSSPPQLQATPPASKVPWCAAAVRVKASTSTAAAAGAAALRSATTIAPSASESREMTGRAFTTASLPQSRGASRFSGRQPGALAQPVSGGGERGVGEDLLDAVERLDGVADALVEHHLAVELLGELVEVLAHLLRVGTLGEAAQVVGAAGEVAIGGGHLL